MKRTMSGNGANSKTSRKIDIFAATETWENNNALSSSKYVWLGMNKPAPKHQFKGVGAFIRKGLAKYTTIIDQISDHRVMWLQIITEDTPLFIAIAYISPNSTEDLTYAIDNITVNYDKLRKIGKVISMGDFNCRMGKHTGDSTLSSRGKMLLEMGKSTGLRVTKSNQTPDQRWTHYHTRAGQSIIDVVLSNLADRHSISKLEVHKNVSFGSDHRLVTFNWNLGDTHTRSSATDWRDNHHQYIAWSDKDIQTFREGIKTEQWTQENKSLHDPNKLTENLIHSMQQAIAPIIKTINTDCGNKGPVSSDYIETLLAKRNALLSKIHEDQKPTDRQKSTNAMSEVHNSILSEIKRLENLKFDKVWTKILDTKRHGPPDEYWKMIKRMRQQSEFVAPALVITTRGVITGRKPILNEFAATYRAVYENKDKEAEDYHKLNKRNSTSHKTKKKREEIKKIFNQIQKSSNNKEIMNGITLPELIEAIKVTKKHTAPGIDNISIDAINHGGEPLWKCILICFQSMWKHEVTPSCLQKGKITPIFKKGDTNDPSCYRPITLLSCIFKLYEKVLERRLRKIVDEKNILPEVQIGTRSKVGTIEGIFNILSTMEQNRKARTLAVLDLSKAYDRVWRKGLWAKLWSVGIKGKLLRLLMSTYSNPVLEVTINQVSSDPFQMADGLRQGSVLSPILFTILFSDTVKDSFKCPGLPLNTSDGVVDMKGQCFIDDTILMAKTPSEIIAQIDSFNENAAVWGSILNLHKTRIISNQSLKTIKEWMELNKISQDQSTSCKYLGVVISTHNSTFNTHYDEVISKARRCLYFIVSKGINKHNAPMNEALFLLNRILIPKLLYAFEITTPSKYVSCKIDKFLAETIDKITHIPIQIPEAQVLWEAGVDTTELSQMRAKLRFHFKLSDDNYTSICRRTYTEENYLRKEVSSILNKLNLSEFDHDKIRSLTTNKNMTKSRWKTKINKALQEWDEKNAEIQFPQLASIKPKREIEEWITKIPTSSLPTLYLARNGMGVNKICPCNNKIVEDVGTHVMIHCSLSKVKMRRLVIIQQLEDLLPSLEHKNIYVKMQVLLGKDPLSILNQGCDDGEMFQVRKLVAQFLHTTSQLWQDVKN